MTNELLEGSRRRRAFADVALLVTTVALMLSLAVAATAVSIGMARAETLGGIAESDGGRFALAVLLALVIAGMGGLTALMTDDGERPLRRD